MVDRLAAGGERSRAQTFALLFGAVFVLVGILGFVPGITTNAPGEFAGEDSDGSLLGRLPDQRPAQPRAPALRARRPGAGPDLGDGPHVPARRRDRLRRRCGSLGLLGALDWLPADDTDDWLHLVLGDRAARRVVGLARATAASTSATSSARARSEHRRGGSEAPPRTSPSVGGGLQLRASRADRRSRRRRSRETEIRRGIVIVACAAALAGAVAGPAVGLAARGARRLGRPSRRRR